MKNQFHFLTIWSTLFLCLTPMVTQPAYKSTQSHNNSTPTNDKSTQPDGPDENAWERDLETFSKLPLPGTEATHGFPLFPVDEFYIKTLESFQSKLKLFVRHIAMHTPVQLTSRHDMATQASTQQEYATSLMQAAASDPLMRVKELLNSEVTNVNEQDEHGNTALMKAVNRFVNRFECVIHRIYETDNYNGNLAILINEDLQIILTLMHAGANANIENYVERTPLSLVQYQKAYLKNTLLRIAKHPMETHRKNTVKWIYFLDLANKLCSNLQDTSSQRQ